MSLSRKARRSGNDTGCGGSGASARELAVLDPVRRVGLLDEAGHGLGHAGLHLGGMEARQRVAVGDRAALDRFVVGVLADLA